MRIPSLQLLTAAGPLIGVKGVSAALYESVLKTNYGPVQGYPAFNSSPAGNIANWADITAWKNIPYGADTSGNNRWKPPQPVTPWNTTRDAKDFGLVCPGESGSGYAYGEDCLSVNIWSAAKSPSDGLPVILWHHPAGGSGPDPLFDGAGMASKGVVFVNCNRRDGPLGWLGHPELNEEMIATVGANSSGNWGLLDEFAALNWTYHNIASFGGDPTRITVVGQSAGSAAVYHTVNSNLTKGQIFAAIAESGVRDPRDPLATTLAEGYNNMSYTLYTGIEYLAANNLSTIEELRAVPLADLLYGNSSSVGPNSIPYNFRPTLDYWAMPHKYIDQLRIGPGNDVPFMTGNTKDESGAEYGLNITVAEYLEEMEAQYGNLTSQALKLYHYSNDTQASMSYNAMWRDTSLVSSFGWAKGWRSSAKSEVYTYYWDHAPPGQDQGAYHESEITYALNNLYGTDLPWEMEDYDIAERMSAYWANFAKTGDPNKGGSYTGNGTLVRYDSSSANETITMHLGNGWGMVPIASGAQVKFLQNYFALQSPL
ncbi:prolyl oligopeptidase-like protein [Annulohypoxylon moriforme]|nr:prolyl oligopeptidase-like protein [Annulohypoxylon moriforme]